MSERVVITGLGAISSLGMSAESQFQAACAGQSGIRPFKLTSGAAIETSIAGVIQEPLPSIFTPSESSLFDRVALMSWVAAQQALNQSGLGDLAAPDRDRYGIFWGTGFGGSTTIEASYDDIFLKKKDRVRPFTIMGVMANGAAALISLKTGFTGPSITYATACASSAHAIGEAFRQIRHGYCDRAIVGGAESLLQSGPIKAWEALKTLAKVDAERPYASCKPFSLKRTGFVLGEAAAALVIESKKSAESRGATILAEIVGYGTSSDSVHITKPDPQGQAKAMRAAIQDAGISPSQIAYVNAHGTATQVGDIAETESIKIVFGDHAKRLAISSTKAIHGHTLGAAGALEMVIGVQSQINKIVTPTAFLEDPDPACDLDYVPCQARSLDIPYAISNSFAFGGSNVAIITKVWQ